MKLSVCCLSITLSMGLCLVGCRKPAPAVQFSEQAVRYDLKITGSPVMNPDALGNAMSVVTRLYYLKDKEEFTKLTFEMLSPESADTEALTKEVLGRQEVAVVPGGTFDSLMEMPAGTKYLGIIGFFRNPDPHFWRVLLKADHLRPTPNPKAKKKKADKNEPAPRLTLRVHVEGNRLRVENFPMETIPGQPCGGSIALVAPAKTPTITVPSATPSSPVPTKVETPNRPNRKRCRKS